MNGQYFKTFKSSLYKFCIAIKVTIKRLPLQHIKNIFLFTKIKIKDLASLFSGLPLVLTKNESYQNFKQISLNKYYMYIVFIVVEIHEKER